jgi:hypothetical protein
MRPTKTCVALAIVAAAVGIVLTITDAPAAGLSRWRLGRSMTRRMFMLRQKSRR